MCGVFGIFGHDEAANLAYLGLHALQHRGQESCGITTTGEGRLLSYKGEGRVAEVFGEAELARLPGRAAIGHVRYATAGGQGIRNAQPLAVRYGGGWVGLAHNGQLTNSQASRERLEEEGSIFSGESDTEVLVHLIARSRAQGLESRLVDALGQVTGAYSLTVLGEEQLIGVRDPHGVRPLVMGRLGGATILASETSALHLIGAEYEREIEPGEMVVVDASGVRSVRLPFGAVERHACIFEHVYFARPDTRLFGTDVYYARKAMGRRLALESPAEGDVVFPVPDSGIAAAIGYSEASGLPYEMGLVRSHYIGRTFIEPAQSIRHFGVKLKLAPIEAVIRDRRVVVIDDSLVRGTTSRKIIALLRGAGAREVHLRISSPPITGPCFYGIDTPSKAELVAAQHDVPAIQEMLGCDSLAFLSREGLLEAVNGAGARRGWCAACFSGHYPIPISDAPRR